MDIESFWEYSDPSTSEERFRKALVTANDEERLELLTQVARTYSLRGHYKEAHRLLDEIEPELSGAGPRARVRYELERGRTLNSSGEIERAKAHFQRAWEIAHAEGLEGLAVDAAHMLAITVSGQPEAGDWVERGLALARPSADPKARALIPAMLNNAAWDLHDQGRYQEALPLFEEALAAWTATGKFQQIQIAQWAVGRCLRSLDRFDEALAIQLDLEAVHMKAGDPDGFVYEEIAENLWALDRQDEARPYFQKAFDELSRDEWLVDHEAARLSSLKIRAGMDPRMGG